VLAKPEGVFLARRGAGRADAGGAPPPKRPLRGPRAAGLMTGVVLVLGIVASALAVDQEQARTPGAFYAAPSPLPAGPPGTIIRTESIKDPPAGSMGWRILYLSRSYTGKPTALSGLLFVPTAPAPAGGRNVVALTHGTTGVAPGCAVSLSSSEVSHFVDGLPEFIRAGDSVVVPDYQGLGTPGPHPYLVGDSEAAAALDAVRAAHLFGPAQAGTTFAVFGASQGGHAALFTGQRAASYAPELRLAGVAAAAPASDLKALFEVNQGPAGKLLSAYTIDAWSQVYPQLRVDQVVAPVARPIVKRLARLCIAADTSTKIRTGVLTTLLKVRYLTKPPWKTEPWKGLLETNSAGRVKVPAPMIITQGEADTLVRPPITAAFAKRLCAAGQTVLYRTYPGVDHIQAGPKTAPDVARWIADRFAGTPAPSTCR